MSSSLLLTDRQAEELHKSIIAYLGVINAPRAAEAFREEANIPASFDEATRKKYEGILEKKWTSVVRLQKKVVNMPDVCTCTAYTYSFIFPDSGPGAAQRQLAKRTRLQHTDFTSTEKPRPDRLAASSTRPPHAPIASSAYHLRRISSRFLLTGLGV